MAAEQNDSGVAVAAEDTYIVQLFSAFAPAEANPLILRLHIQDTVDALIEKALEKYSTLKTIVVTPSTSIDDYVLIPATGHGSPMPGMWPLKPQTVVRNCGLEFPYMLCLTWLPPSDSGEATRPSIMGKDGSSLIASEKEAIAAHKAKIVELRTQRVSEIERVQQEREKKHFQHCESYEILRREETLKAERQRKEAAQKAEALAQAKGLREEVEKQRAQEAEESMLETHRKAVEAKVAEQQARQDAIARQREEVQRKQLEQKHELEQKLKIERERDQERRLKGLEERLLEKLHTDIDHEKEDDEHRILWEQGQRQARERASLELQRVEHLEKTRAIVKEVERSKRCTEAAAEEVTRHTLEQTKLEEAERERAEEERRFAEWKSQRNQQLEAVESQLELEYRASRVVTSPPMASP